MGDRTFFAKLAPFLQEYIYSQDWTELKPVQIAASQVIFETDAHLLIAAGTAAGKTEAAFLPVLTLLHEQPSTSVGILYISPIKALINDQFDRLNAILKDAEIPVWYWHGDVSAKHKKQLLKEAQGILQITPESLESLLINQYGQLNRLFGDLRFIIIDEIHAFMGSERGYQILCQLSRLAKATNNQPRRIGLSATLGDCRLAENWLAAGTDKTTITPEILGGQRKIHLAVEHFYRHQPPEVTEELKFSDYHQYIFEISQARKCLIFANNRAETETAIATLRQIAAANNLPDIYHVHHGSISAKLRETAERAMRYSSGRAKNYESAPAVIAATITLELGIDLGQLERVIQLEAPLSVASFLQRLGRTGRRGNPADMRFICAEDTPEPDAPLPNQIPWQLLQCIAIIQLYLEEKWIEPIPPARYPFSLLYHQTMSILAALGELSPSRLAEEVLTLPTFTNIAPGDFQQLLRHLIEIQHIEITERGELIIGVVGEKIVRNFQFYAVFAAESEYVARTEILEIGSIVKPPPKGKLFTLAARTWEVVDIDFKNKIVLVKEGQGEASVSWHSHRSSNIHSKVLQRMRQVLFEELQYSYLQSNAKERLAAARTIAKNTQLGQNAIAPISGNKYCFFPWMGTIAYRTLERCLNLFGREAGIIRNISGKSPYFLTLQIEKGKLADLSAEIVALGDRAITPNELLLPQEAPRLQKYDEFIPPNLLCKAFASDYLDVAEMQAILKTGNW
jgi:ATP-dependent Lhr-like helicase